MKRLLAILTLAASPAFAQVWWATNEITGVVAPSTFLTFGAGPMRVTLTAHDGGVPIDLSEETVRLIVQDRGDMKAVYSNVATRVSGSTYRGEATLTASTNQYDVRMVLFPQGDPINYYPIYWARVTVTSIPETVSLNLGNLLINATNNIVAQAAVSGTVLRAMGDGTLKLEPETGGGGGPTTGQVNLVTINGTNYQGNLALEASGLLRLAPTGLTINAYVGTEDVFAGLQSYASPLTNVIAWNVGGQPVGMSPLVPGYQLTTDGSNWYLGADAAGTAIATNAIYQLGHNGTIVGPLNTAIFDSPFAVTALGGGTARVSYAESTPIVWQAATTNGYQTGTTNYLWNPGIAFSQEIYDPNQLYNPTSYTFSVTSGLWQLSVMMHKTQNWALALQTRVMVGGTATAWQCGAYRPEINALRNNGIADAGFRGGSSGVWKVDLDLITTQDLNNCSIQMMHYEQVQQMRYHELLATMIYMGPVP